MGITFSLPSRRRWSLFVVARFHEFSNRALLFADAVSLAFFTMIGVKKALIFAAPAPVAVTMGVITGVAGGILRDILTGEIPYVFRKEIYFYATASLCGAVVFVWLQHWPFSLLLGASVTLALRLAAIRWKLALPLFNPRQPPE